MTRNLRTLGLTLLAVGLLGAVMAESASATETPHEFHSDGEKTVVIGKQTGTHKFAVGSAGTVECTTAEFKATMVATKITDGTWKADKLTVAPAYSGCTFGGQPATVSYNHCADVFDSDTTDGNLDGGLHANVEVECSGGSEIEIDTSVCTITIGAQTVNHAVSYKNDTGSSFETIATGKKIKTGKKKTTESQTGCLLFPTGEIGTYNGTTTSKCSKDEGEPQSGTAATTPSLTEGTTTECTVS